MKRKHFLVIFLLPLAYLLMLSLFSFYRYPKLLPCHFTLAYWQNVIFMNPLFYKGLISSLIIGTLTAILATVIGLMTGKAVKQYNKTVAILVSLPLFIPGIVLFLSMHQVVLASPVKNSLLGIVLVHSVICLPYTTNIAIAYYHGIPKEYDAISKTLGGSSWYTFKKIYLPLLKPGIAMSLMMSFLISNTEYFSTFLIGGGKVVTLSMVMFPYISNSDYGHASVMGLIFIGIHAVLFIAIDYIVKDQVSVLYGGN